jgi:hypothetical protein
MKARNTSALVLIGALAAMAEAAYGTQPPDVVNSDAYFNTAMGTGALFSLTPSSDNEGYYNTASGDQALYSDTTGTGNTASGDQALYSNTNGYENTAAGFQALFSNTTGGYNTATGAQALASNTTGSGNTASGLDALFHNSTGHYNSAAGAEALSYNTTGSLNTASGYEAMFFNTTGASNTASGYQALLSNTTGGTNTASGVGALFANTSGGGNTATGFHALYANTTGIENTATGQGALYSNSTGSNNIAVGFQAGLHLSTGNHNIDIGNVGVAGETGVIRIGTSLPSPLQTATYIAGIYGTSVSGSPVYVASNGQLGTVVSSERFKTAIMPMGSDTAKLGQLRPVTFKLKSDATGTRQYGLIAEEVAKVYPELVIRDQSGRIDGVRYDELAPMLLNEVQQQLTQTTEKFDAQAAQIRELKQELAELNARK